MKDESVFEVEFFHTKLKQNVAAAGSFERPREKIIKLLHDDGINITTTIHNVISDWKEFFNGAVVILNNNNNDDRMANAHNK